MKAASTLMGVLLFGMGVASASAAVEEAGQEERPGSQPEADSDRPCRPAIERSALLNSGQLFEAAEACAHEGATDDAVFLQLAGQVRALTDMSLLKPVSEKEQRTVTRLYGALYYKYGGSGPDDLFRDPVRSSAMFKRLGRWRPAFREDYNPGWRYQGPVGSDRYRAKVDHSMKSRLAKLASYRNLLEDDRYYAVHRERRELLARNDNTIGPDTDAADRARIAELDELAAEISRSIAREPEPPLPPELLPDTAPNASAPQEERDAVE